MEERLKKFVTLVDAGTYTAAARQLHTSQPALTVAMHKLESELKAPLLMKHGRKLQLTPAGNLAYERGRALLLAERNFLDELATLRAQKTALCLGSIDSVAAMAAENGLLSFLERDHELTVNVQGSAALIAQLQTGVLDAALVVRQPEIPKGLLSQPVGHERFALVCAPQRRPEYMQAAKDGELFDFLAYDAPSTTQGLILRQLEAQGIACRPRLHSSNPAVLLQLVLQGRGVAALPESMLPANLSTKFAKLPLKKPLERHIDAYWPAGRVQSAATAGFLAALSDLLRRTQR